MNCRAFAAGQGRVMPKASKRFFAADPSAVQRVTQTVTSERSTPLSRASLALADAVIARSTRALRQQDTAAEGGKAMRLPRHARLLFALLFAVAIAAGRAVPAQAAEPSATVIEFYNAALNHYFITAYGDEAAMLDAGVVVPGWVRTGVTWKAWASASDSATAVAASAFFGTPGVGPNSHFYTADANECALVTQNPGWTFEGIAFFIEVPQNGGCKPGTTPVYRSFYPGARVSQSNHRFLTDLTLHESMA